MPQEQIYTVKLNILKREKKAMANRSSMFLRNFTAIDYAFLNEKGVIRGGSFHVNAIVSGEIDPIEKVVVDFSTIKKDLKDIIDDRETGFDHKLWYIDGLSKGIVKSNIAGNYIQIDTPATSLIVPGNSVRLMDHQLYDFEKNAAMEIADHIQYILEQKYPDVDIDISIALTRNSFMDSHKNFCVTFNYIHGLKDSTSWGCQNLSHGHSSWVEFSFDGCRDSLSNQDIIELISIVEEMNNGLFIFDQNIAGETNDEITIGYVTERGPWAATYNKNFYNVIKMSEETTIENIAVWFEQRNHYLLKSLGVTEVFVSEGLAKGAVESVQYSDDDVELDEKDGYSIHTRFPNAYE